jgi:ubiquinone/menaquinone biosynthesis C-methylase UbiE
VNKTKKEGLERVIKTQVSSAAKIDFIPDGSVDFVFAYGLLCCMADHRSALAQIKRILKPLGLAYFSVSKTLRKSDTLAVKPAEWEGILKEFKVIETGEGIFTRWAIVSSP